MANELGDIRGSLILDVTQAVKAYTEARQQHLSTVSALGAGEGAIRNVGQNFLDAGKAMAAGFLTAVEAAGEFERKLDFFSAVSNATQEEFDAIRESALQLGADTIYSADQIAESFIELGKSGVKAQDIIDGIGEGVAALGAAADIPLDTAANIMTAAVQTFQLGAENAVDVANKLAGAANASVVDVQDLGVSLKYVGGVAASLGVDFDETNTALALLGKYGIRGSTAGTALRQTLLSLNGGTKKATASLKELGIISEDGTNAFYDQNGSAKSLAEIFQILQDATVGYSDQARTAILKTIFATRALPTVNALMKEGADGFAGMMAEIEKTTALDVASQRLDNLSGDIEYLRGEMDTLIVNMGATMQGAARSFIQSIEGVVAWLNTLDAGTLSVIMSITGIVAGFLALVGVAALLSAAFLNIYQTAIILRDLFPFLTKVTKALAVAMKLLASAMFGNPFGIIITIVIALAAALAYFFTQTETGQQVWGQLMALFQQGLATVMPLLGQLITFLGGALASALEFVVPLLLAFGQFLMGVLQPVLAIITPLLTGLADAFSGVGSSAGGLEGIVEIITSVYGGILAAIPMIVDALVSLITLLIGAVAEYLPMMIEAGLTLLTGLITALVQILPVIIQAVISLITQLLTALIGFLPMLVSAALTLFKGIITALATIIPLLIFALIDLLSTLIAALIGAIPLILDAAIGFFMAIVEAIPVIIPLLIDAILALILGLITAIVEAIPMLLDAAILLFMSLIDAVIEIVPDLIVTIIELIPVLLGALISMIPALLNGAIKLFLAIVDALPKIIPKLIDAVINLLPKLIGALFGLIPKLLDAAFKLFMAIVDAGPKILPALGRAVLKIGEAIINGIVKGIQNLGGAVADALGGIVNGAVGWVQDLLGIHSPSRVFAAIGVNTILGLIDGIQNQRRSLTQEMGMIADDMTTFYDQVGAAADLEASISLASQVGVGASADRMAAELAILSDRLEEIAAKDTINVEKLEVNNPEAEPVSDSLPTAIRKTAYVVG